MSGRDRRLAAFFRSRSPSEDLEGRDDALYRLEPSGENEPPSLVSTLTGAALGVALLGVCSMWLLELRTLQIEALPAHGLMQARVEADEIGDGPGTATAGPATEQVAVHSEDGTLAVQPSAVVPLKRVPEIRQEASGYGGAALTSVVPPRRPPADVRSDASPEPIVSPATQVPLAAARASLDSQGLGRNEAPGPAAPDIPPTVLSPAQREFASPPAVAQGPLPAPDAPERPRLEAVSAQAAGGSFMERELALALPSSQPSVPVVTWASPAALSAVGTQPFEAGRSTGGMPDRAPIDRAREQADYLAAELERAFTFTDGPNALEQAFSVDGCDAVLTVTLEGDSSGIRQQEISTFELQRFRLVESEKRDRVLLAANADASKDLMLWYHALAEESTDGALLLRLERGDFGSFPARNRRETRNWSGEGATPWPIPLAQVSLLLPRETAAATEIALRAYVDDYCRG